MKRFFRKTWLFLTAAGVIVVCTVLLAQSVRTVSLSGQNQAEKIATEYQVEQPGEAVVEELPMSAVLPAAPYEPPAYTLAYEYAYGEMADDPGVLEPVPMAESALRAVGSLFGADMAGARVFLTYRQTEEKPPSEQYCIALIFAVSMDAEYRFVGDRYGLYLDARTGEWETVNVESGRTLPPAEGQDPEELPGGWYADDYAPEAVAMTDEQYIAARKQAVLKLKNVLETYLLNGRTVADAAPVYRTKEATAYDGGVLIPYEVVLSDGEGCVLTFSAWPGEEPRLISAARGMEEGQLAILGPAKEAASEAEGIFEI